MEIKINIPDNFTHDYTIDKFKDFFSRIAVDIDNGDIYGCRDYERAILEMFLKALDESIEANNTCNCQHNNNSRNSEPCCRCDGRQTNADRIRSMSDGDLLDFICSIETYDQGSVKTIEGGVAMCSVSEVEKWLQSPVDDEVSDVENFEVRR